MEYEALNKDGTHSPFWIDIKFNQVSGRGGEALKLSVCFLSLSLHFTSRALSRGGVGGPDPSSPKVSVGCIFWHHPQFPHVTVHKIAPSPSGSASWSPSGDLHVVHLSEVAFLFPTVHMPRPSEAALPCFAFYTPYPQLFSDIFTLHFVFHCHPLDSSQHSHFCLF